MRAIKISVWLMLAMSLSTTTWSAPREKAICAGTVTSNWRPSTASTSAVVATAAIWPLFSADHSSLSPLFRRTWKPYCLAKIEFGLGAMPPLATIRPP